MFEAERHHGPSDEGIRLQDGRGVLEDHELSSESASETIPHVFQERGPTTPRVLDGMFAFVIAREG